MMTEEDKSLFLLEVNDIPPLENRRRAEQYCPKTIKEQTQKTLKKVKTRQRNQTKALTIEEHENQGFAPQVSAHEQIMHHQKGIRIQELSKLKKGEFANQAQLDLHGYIRDEAEFAIQEFISAAYQDKLRYLRIVHGKGYNSDEQSPILKNLVNQTLRQLKVVLAFCSTPEKDGGTGAVNVLIKKH